MAGDNDLMCFIRRRRAQADLATTALDVEATSAVEGASLTVRWGQRCAEHL